MPLKIVYLELLFNNQTHFMVGRSPNDKCLICLIRDANQKGSHYTPASLIKRPFGKVDYEEIYSISSEESTVDVFYGRSNPDNTDPTIRAGEHKDDYIFCSDCERKLSFIEGQCSNELNLMLDSDKQQNLKFSTTSKGNKYLVLQKLHSNLLTLFFYSVIVRQCIQQRLHGGSNAISSLLENPLREILLTEMYKSLDEINSSDVFSHAPRIIVITNLGQQDYSKNSVCPNDLKSNPNVFFMGIVDVLLFSGETNSSNFFDLTGIDSKLLDDELVLNQDSVSKIAFVDDLAWNNKNDKFLDRYGKRFFDNVVDKVARHRNWPVAYAHFQLVTLATSIQKQTGERFFYKCVILASRQILC